MNSDNWYVDTIQVGEIEGDQVGLWTCLGCGSLVRGLFKETHEKWHQGTEGGWQVPGDLAERVAAADYRDAWGLEIKRTAEVREILQDLIAELREGHPTFGDEPPLWVKTALYAAENRLRKSTRDD